MLFDGDFRQIPPMLRRVDIHGWPAQTLKTCDWWVADKHLKSYKRGKNKRAEEDPEFAKLILQIGEGEYQPPTDAPLAAIDTPEQFLAKRTTEMNDFLEWAYGGL